MIFVVGGDQVETIEYLYEYNIIIYTHVRALIYYIII